MKTTLISAFCFLLSAVTLPAQNLAPLCTNAAVVTAFSQAPMDSPIPTPETPTKPIDIDPAHFATPIPALNPAISLKTSVIGIGPIGTNLLLKWQPSNDPNAVEQNLYSGPSRASYTNCIGIPDNITSQWTVSNITSRTFWVISTLDTIGDEVFSAELYWPPFTNIIIFTDPTNLLSAPTPNGPWTDEHTATLCFTNVTGNQFFRGTRSNGPTIQQLTQ